MSEIMEFFAPSADYDRQLERAVDNIDLLKVVVGGIWPRSGASGCGWAAVGEALFRAPVRRAISARHRRESTPLFGGSVRARGLGRNRYSGRKGWQPLSLPEG